MRAAGTSKSSTSRVALVGLCAVSVVTAVLVVLALRHVAPVAVEAAPTPASRSSRSAQDHPSKSPTASIDSPGPSQSGDVAAFVGDGFSMVSKDEGKPWPERLAQIEGWEDVMFGAEGMGYNSSDQCDSSECDGFSALIPDIAAVKPDIVVISGGASDGDIAIGKATVDFYAELSRELPNARIIAISPLWKSKSSPYWLNLHAANVKESAIMYGGEYVDIGQPLSKKLMDLDGTFPNAKGHQEVAAAISESLG